MVNDSRINLVRRPVACRYDAAVPELSAGLPRIPGLPWESLSPRPGPGRAGTRGLGAMRVADWAVALRSPEGTTLVAGMPV